MDQQQSEQIANTLYVRVNERVQIMEGGNGLKDTKCVSVLSSKNLTWGCQTRMMMRVMEE